MVAVVPYLCDHAHHWLATSCAGRGGRKEARFAQHFGVPVLLIDLDRNRAWRNLKCIPTSPDPLFWSEPLIFYADLLPWLKRELTGAAAAQVSALQLGRLDPAGLASELGLALFGPHLKPKPP